MLVTKRRRGRPDFVPTKAQREDVMLYIAGGISEASIAHIIGITHVTLRKHFEVELRTGREVVRSENLRLLRKAAKKGNVSAIRMLEEKSHIQPQRTMPDTPAEPKPVKLGKKAQAQAEAERPDTTVPMGELMARRAARLN